jgi:hypothetical protein
MTPMHHVDTAIGSSLNGGHGRPRRSIGRMSPIPHCAIGIGDVINRLNLELRPGPHYQNPESRASRGLHTTWQPFLGRHRE